MPPARVVVTGLGCLSPLGLDVASTWAGLVAGRSGVSALRALPGRPEEPVDDLAVRVAGQLPGFDPVAHLGVKAGRTLDRVSQLAVVAAREAVASAGLDVAARPERVGVVVGTGLGGLATFEREVGVQADRGPARVSPYLSAAVIPNAPVAAVSIDSGARGPSLAPVSACATGTDALGLAADMLRLGRADAVLVGGSEAPLLRTLLGGFGTLRAATRRTGPDASRPFSRDRDGFVVAEGAAVLVLEDRDAALARGATLLAELVGYGAASDAHHVTAPHPAGRGAAAALRAALDDAGVSPSDVGYVNAHATATPDGDLVEAQVLRAVLGEHLPPVSSTKGVTGHLLGAAGALEALACVLALRDGVLPPTAHVEHDPEIGLDVVPHEAREAPDLDVVVSEGFGFGGHDAAVVLRRCGGGRC